MKFRTGFVSNSSSSSFVFRKDEEFKTTLDIAKAIVLLKKWDGDKALMQKLRSMGNYNLPIAFRSCNYDTYIAKEGRIFYVYTCNNYPFYNILYNDFYNIDIDLNEIEKDIKENNYFYWPEYNIEVTCIDDYIFCKKCYMEYHRDKNGNIICPSCKEIK